MDLDRVEFTFNDGTVCEFTRSKERWISWTARVHTKAERLKAHREHRVAKPGTWFRDEFLQPTLAVATRLVKSLSQQRKAERVQQGAAT